MSHDGNTHALESLYEKLLEKGFDETEAGKLAFLKFALMGEMGYDKREPEPSEEEE